MVAPSVGRNSKSSRISKPFARQQLNPVAVAQVELGALRLGPVDPVQTELRSEELRPRRLFVILRAQHEQQAVAEEDQLRARAQDPGHLRDPLVRIGPDGRAVLADRQIEGVVRKREELGGRTDQREVCSELALELDCDLELARGGVERHRCPTPPGEPR